MLCFCACLNVGHAQNVGIGTSAPQQKLHIASSTPQTGLLIDHLGAEGNPVLQYGLDGQVVFSIGVDDADEDKLKFGGSTILSQTSLTLRRNGYVGFGTTHPIYDFEVLNDRPSNYVAHFQNTNPSGSGLGVLSTNTYNAIGGISENNAGIGVYGVHLPSDGVGWGVWGTSNSSNGIGVRGTVPTTGTWLGYGGYFTGGLAYTNGLYNLSDARMKTDVRTLEGALDKVGQLRGVTYKYNSSEFGDFVGNDPRTYIGFVAQEVEQVFPESVAEKYLIGGNGLPAGATANGVHATQTVKVVDYVSLVPVLVEAIKEQQAYIRALEKRLEKIENE